MVVFCLGLVGECLAGLLSWVELLLLGCLAFDFAFLLV